MLFNELLRKHFPDLSADLTDQVPADVISRQNWQDCVEALISDIRKLTGKPAYGLSEAEITVHFHLPLKRMVALLEDRLGMTKPP